MSGDTSIWVRIFSAIANFFRLLFKKKEPPTVVDSGASVEEPGPPSFINEADDVFTATTLVPNYEEGIQPVIPWPRPATPTERITGEKMWEKEQLLTPLLHRRLITLYCIADLEDGDVQLLDSKGNFIHSVSEHSRKRLDMEGTGSLSTGKVINVAVQVDGEWRYKVMGPNEPYGVGIRSTPLVPWMSVAHHLQQLRTHNMFGRTVIIPSLKGYKPPNAEEHTGQLKVHDTGGGLRKCPYERGLWRTGPVKEEYGQFDLFIGGPESVYKGLLGTWDCYREVFVMPRDTESEKGIQETLNLLLDTGLKVDGFNGVKTKEAITQLQIKAGLEETGIWDLKTKEFAELSLNNW